MKKILRKVFPRPASQSEDKNYSPFDPTIVRAYQKTRSWWNPPPYLCMAPFKSLFFGHFGKVSVCCYNRSYTVGTYPDQSIKDIWFGEKIEVLRDFIRHNDLTLGCNVCSNLLKANNFEAAKPHFYDYLKNNANQYPSLMEFELSNTCNLECIMCNGDFSSTIRKNREKKPPLPNIYDEEFVDQLEPFLPYLQKANFFGGEPFLVDIYYDIWDRMVSVNPYTTIVIQTNATILNQRVKNLLEKINFAINISIDSLQKDNYEFIRKNAHFEKVMENILYFRAYCKRKKTDFIISCCAMVQNWQELPDFIEFCNRLEAPVHFHQVILPLENTLSILPASELKEIYEQLYLKEFPARTSIQKKNKKQYHGIVNTIKNWMDKAIELENEVKAARFKVIRPIISVEDLQSHLCRFLKTCELKAKEKKEKISALNYKFAEIKQHMSNESNITEIIIEKDLESPFYLMELINTLISVPVVELMKRIDKNEK